MGLELLGPIIPLVVALFAMVVELGLELGLRPLVRPVVVLTLALLWLGVVAPLAWWWMARSLSSLRPLVCL